MANLGPSAPMIQQEPRTQATQNREDSKGRQKEPDTIMAGCMRHRAEQHQESPVSRDQKSDRFDSPISQSAPKIPALPISQEPDRSDHHRPDQRVVPRERLLGVIVDRAQELNSEYVSSDRGSDWNGRIEQACRRFGPPGRHQGVKDDESDSNPSNSVLKARRLR